MPPNRSVLHFFWIYFGSVAILIIGAGFFYYFEQNSSLLSKEKESMLQYAKMQQYTGGTYFDPLFTFIKKAEYRPWYKINLLQKRGDYFIYEVPTKKPNEFLVVKKSIKVYEKAKRKMLIKMLLIESILLSIFTIISWFLANESIKPLNQMIRNLDDFIKNLVHDLNTPATSILLNARLLQTNKGVNDEKRIARIESSTNEILSLYKNLSILLNEHKLEVVEQDIVPIIQNNIQHFKELYEDIEFTSSLPEEFIAKVDKQAFEQILNNLISNACKYRSEKDAKVKIGVIKNGLVIKDNGLGMEHPKKVFQRLYSEHTQGHGIGMHIVKKLTQLMDIEILFESKKGVGTEIRLHFK